MTKKMYVSDLDGTLLNSQGEISEYSVGHLNALIQKGVLFTVASARSLQSIKNILKDVHITLPVISFNGGYVSDFNTMKHIVVNHLQENVAMEIYDAIKDQHGMFISTFDGQRDMLYFDRITSEGMSLYQVDREKMMERQILQLDTFDVIKYHSIMAYTVIDHKDKILQLKETLNKQFGTQIVIDAWEDMYYRPWYWLTVHDKNSTKDQGIKKMSNLINSTFDALIVFGDNSNDIDMFKMANQSYAVENAVDRLKGYATAVIGENNTDSVVKKILDLEE